MHLEDETLLLHQNEELRVQNAALRSLIDRIASGGPIGVRVAVDEVLRKAEREAQQLVAQPFKGAQPTDWRQTALGEFYHYKLSGADVKRLLMEALGFSDRYSFSVLNGVDIYQPLELYITLGDPAATP
jgi:hypothetical protein